MTSVLGTSLGVELPILVAPMAGGPSTPELVIAAAAAGSCGFIAAGYKSPEALAEQVQAVRDSTVVFGVNLFAPNPVPVDPMAFRAYAGRLQPEADRYGIDLRLIEPVEDDDAWSNKIDLLLANPVPVVSFTFGIPAASVVRRFRSAGTVTIQTVTSAAEAQLAEAAGVDLLAVQAAGAGGHYGTLTPLQLPPPLPLLDLIAAVRAASRLPVVAAGGIATSAEVAGALHAGAATVVVGTVLLRCSESGASPVHRAALADPNRGDTVVTRAFTGRPARALPNRFTEQYSAIAPSGYPALHHLTGPVRRAATVAGDPELVNLWAGTGYRAATDEPAAVILARLAATL
jgi:nitronate monooxygenase